MTSNNTGMKTGIISVLLAIMIVSWVGRRFASDPIITHRAKTYGHKNITLDLDYSYEYERKDGGNQGM